MLRFWPSIYSWLAGEAIKHEVQDFVQQEKSHPMYYSLFEEWEKFIQSLQNPQPRTAYVRRPGTLDVTKISTITVNDQACSLKHLVQIKLNLAMSGGIAKEEMLKDLVSRNESQVENTNSAPPLRESVKKATI